METKTGIQGSRKPKCKDISHLKTECRESQEWTYGIDNTGTRFNDVADYVITLSDGSTLNFSQDGSSGGWTVQLQEWATNIQDAADAAGLAWFVEPRFVDTYNPSNIDGTINGPGGTPSGLPGAPSVPVAIALDKGGMQWRYVNIQICPGQPVPVKAERISSAQFTTNPYDLTTAGAVLGPINKFKVCVECGAEDDLWYIFDKDINGYREANAGEIPNCWEPCGTLSLTDAPPDRDCEFFIDLACDDNGDNANQAGFTNQITRRATVCNGEQISLEYFEEDPNDPAALVPYTLVGDFVDCTTGEIIPLPLIDGISVKCDEDPISESYDSDVRIIGSKHPIPVFVEDNCCVTPANLECIKKRTFDFVYDNGFTPGSSTNDGGERNNLVRFNWAFTSQGWETGAGVVGIGDAIGAYTGWSPQLTGWSTFGNTHDPYNSVSAFNFYGAPTWRGWSVTGCNPSAKYGVWTLLRDDGVTFKVYPTLYTESIERLYRSQEIDCEGNITTRYWEQNNDGQTYTEVPTPDDINCFVSCDYIFENVILPGAESPCETKEYTLCDRVDPNDSSQDVQFIQLVTTCDGVKTIERYTLDSYNNAADPDDLVEYTVVGSIVICGTDDPFVEPIPECNDFDIEILYSRKNITGTLRNREWDLGPREINNQTVAFANTVLDNFDETQATTVDGDWTLFTVNDTNSDNNTMDLQIIDGYILVEQPIDVRWTGTSLGYLKVELGKCCGELETIVEGASGDGTVNPSSSYTLPPGIHKIKFTNLDDFTNTSRTLQYSLDGGVTWINDNTPPFIQLSRTKPFENCKIVRVCKDSGVYLDDQTGELLDKALCYPCKLDCNSGTGSGSGSGANTHLIEGCLEGGIEAFTIVDDTGTPLFAPKPLTDLGFVTCCPDEDTSEGNNYEVSFKSSGIQQIVTDCGTWNGNYDFQSPLAPPQSSDDAGSQMQQAKNSIDAWLANNGGGTVRLEYTSQSILTVTITGSTCVAQSANDDSNPGPHNFTQI